MLVIIRLPTSPTLANTPSKLALLMSLATLEIVLFPSGTSVPLMLMSSPLRKSGETAVPSILALPMYLLMLSVFTSSIVNQYSSTTVILNDLSCAPLFSSSVPATS